jgi:hypothetical protein
MNIYRDRNNKMNAQSVIDFYTQALYNNRKWLEDAINNHNLKEEERIKKFVDRGERELEFAQSRLAGECHCNSQHAHMTYIPHDDNCPAKYAPNPTEPEQVDE